MATAPMTFRLKWTGPQGLGTTFADQLSVMKSGASVYFTFGEVSPPLVVAPDEATTDLAIGPVARIVIPAGAFDAIANVIARPLDIRRSREACLRQRGLRLRRHSL